MFDGELATSNGGQKIELNFVPKVVLLTLETVMGFLVYDNDDVTGDDIWRLVALSGEDDGGTTFHALVDMNVQHLPL
jgi:hypothetical protein